MEVAGTLVFDAETLPDPVLSCVEEGPRSLVAVEWEPYPHGCVRVYWRSLRSDRLEFGEWGEAATVAPPTQAFQFSAPSETVVQVRLVGVGHNGFQQSPGRAISVPIVTGAPKVRSQLFVDKLRFEKILSRVSYPGYAYRVVERRGSLFLQIECRGVDNRDGSPMLWKSRRWLLSEQILDSEVVQTALAATLAAVEHEARESFKYDGASIYDPHYDAAALLELRNRVGATVQRTDARLDGLLKRD